MIDFSTLKELYLDGKKVTSLFLDGHEVPFGEEPTKYFTVTALDQPAGVTITAGAGTPSAFSLEYSTDGDMWSSYSAEQTVTLAAGESVMFRRVGEATTAFQSGQTSYWYIALTAPAKVSGNIMSLLDASMESTTVGEYAFFGLFNGNSNLIDASELELPATTLAPYCYSQMFRGCTSLTAAPALPATIANIDCYHYMFENCTSLSSAPALPATTLASNCYNSMFYNCTSLSSAPALPATTLASYCYQSMFRGCTSLSSAPALPATTLTSNCYYNMFNGCSHLSNIEVAFSTWVGTYTWVYGVAATGTFICPSALGTDETIERGKSKCPTGWTVVNYDAA